MKTITMLVISTCPYCHAALRWMDELFEENEKYKALTINIVDEDLQPEIADKYDYYYVPTYYVDDKKLHEGAASSKIIRRVFDTALVS